MVGDNAYLTKWLPPGADVYTDDLNGRWKITSQNKTKSVSWTTRGMRRGSLLSLRFAWDAYKEMLGSYHLVASTVQLFFAIAIPPVQTLPSPVAIATAPVAAYYARHGKLQQLRCHRLGDC